MRNSFNIGVLSLGAALAIVPAMAQTTPTNRSTTMAPATGTMGTMGTMGNTTSTDRNPVMTQAGDARASKIIGSTVYNDHDEKVGAVDDLLIGKDGKMNVVLSVGGFLGLDTKYVEVPYANLTFGNTQKDSANRVVLKGATKDTLKAQAAYSYTRA